MQHVTNDECVVNVYDWRKIKQANWSLKKKKQTEKKMLCVPLMFAPRGWLTLHPTRWRVYGSDLLAPMKGGTRAVCLHLLWPHLRGLCNHKHTVGHALSISWGVTHLCLLWTMEVVLLLPNPQHSNTLLKQLRIDLFFILAYLTKKWLSCSCMPWKFR